MENISILVNSSQDIKIQKSLLPEKIKKDEILLKIELSQLNPIDFIIQNQHLDFRKYPYITGFDGFGKILKSHNKNLIGKNALFTSLTNGTGQKYAIFKRNEIFVLKNDINLENVKKLFSMNVLTAYGMIQKALKNKSDAVIITGASSKVAKLLAYIAKKNKITPILIGRNYNSRNYYFKKGLGLILNEREENFERDLGKVLESYKRVTVLDCVTGNLQLRICQILLKKNENLKNLKNLKNEENFENEKNLENENNFNVIYYGMLDHNPPSEELVKKLKNKKIDKEGFAVFYDHLERDYEINENFVNEFFKDGGLDLEVEYQYCDLEDLPGIMLDDKVNHSNIIIKH